MSQHNNTEAIILTPSVVALQIEESIADLQNFILPALNAAGADSVNAAVVAEMNIAKLMQLAEVLKGG